MKQLLSVALLGIVVLTSTASWAEKPDHGNKENHGHDKHGGHDHDDYQRDDRGGQAYGGYMGGGSIGFGFDDMQRQMIHDYYYGQISQGRCPPGLAKKGNGCMPPGQAKQWQRGRPLASGVRYYDLPSSLLRRLPPPPVNHRYVQVAGDILLITMGTSMVVDALEDIMQ